MKSRRSQIFYILRIFGILFGISFLIYQIYSSLHGFKWPVITPLLFIDVAIGLAINVFAIMLQMTAWKIVLEGINCKISLSDVFSGFGLSFVARLIPGTVWGYLTRGEWLEREHKIPYAITNLGSIAETIGLLAAGLLIAMQGLLLNSNLPLNLIFIIICILGSWASLNLLILWKPARRLFRLDQNKISIFTIPKWIIVFLLFAGMWYCYGLSLTIYANTIGFSITFAHSLVLSSIYILAWSIGFIVPFLPSGLGLREYSLTILLIAQFGLQKADASFIAIGFRVLVSIAELLWILFGLAKKTLISKNSILISK